MSLAPPDDNKVGRDASASVSSTGASPTGSPVSSPRLRAKPGLFHSLKRQIFSGNKAAEDPEYDSGKRQFHILHDALVRIQTQAKNYITNLQNTVHSAHHISDEFYALFNDAGGAQPHAYVALMSGMNSGHDNLSSDAVLKAYIDQFNTSVLRRLTEELEHHRAVQTRMADRDQLKADNDYYRTKTEKLQAEHDKRLSSGKSDSSQASEKLTRNVEKLNSVKSDYNELNHTLIAELHRMWNERQHVLGPIVTDFLSMERQFLTMYSQALQDIPGPDASHQHQPYAYPGQSQAQPHRMSDVPLNGVNGVTHTRADSNQAIEIQAQPMQPQQPQPPYQTQVVVTPDAVYQHPISQPQHEPQPAGNYATTNGVEDLMHQQQQQHQQHVQETNYAQQLAMNGVPPEGQLVEPQHTSQQAAYEMAQQKARAGSQHNNGIALEPANTVPASADEPAHTAPLEPTEGGLPSGLPAPVQYGESGAVLQH